MGLQSTGYIIYLNGERKGVLQSKMWPLGGARVSNCKAFKFVTSVRTGQQVQGVMEGGKHFSLSPYLCRAV